MASNLDGTISLMTLHFKKLRITTISRIAILALVFCYGSRTAFSGEGGPKPGTQPSVVARINNLSVQREELDQQEQRIYEQIGAEIRRLNQPFFLRQTHDLTNEQLQSLADVLTHPEVSKHQEYASWIKELLDGRKELRELVIKKVLPKLRRDIPASGIFKALTGATVSGGSPSKDKTSGYTLYEEIIDHVLSTNPWYALSELDAVIHNNFLEGADPKRSGEWVNHMLDKNYWPNEPALASTKVHPVDHNRLTKIAELILSKPAGLAHPYFAEWMSRFLARTHLSHGRKYLDSSENKLLLVFINTVMKQPEMLDETHRPLVKKFIDMLVERIKAGHSLVIQPLNKSSNLLTKVLVEHPELRKEPEFGQWLETILSSLSNGSARMPGLLDLFDTDEALDLLEKSGRFSQTLRRIVSPEDNFGGPLSGRPAGQHEAESIIEAKDPSSPFSEKMRSELLKIYLEDNRLTPFILGWWMKKGSPSPEAVKQKVLQLLDDPNPPFLALSVDLGELPENHESTRALRDFLKEGKVKGPVNLGNIVTARKNIERVGLFTRCTRVFRSLIGK